MRYSRFVSVMAVSVLLFTLNSVADENKGAASIVLKGGSLGSIPFPHGRHQGISVNCKPCHELFGKESKVIDRMKGEGTLQKKEVMNVCRDCHKNLAEKGEKAGPTSCKDCHKN